MPDSRISVQHRQYLGLVSRVLDEDAAARLGGNG